MATPVKVHCVKAPRPKTPKDKAKAAANIAAYNQRNAELARLRQFAAACRSQLGYVGPDAVVIAKGQRFANNCRSLYGYRGTDEEVIAMYHTAVRVARGWSRKAA